MKKTMKLRILSSLLLLGMLLAAAVCSLAGCGETPDSKENESLAESESISESESQSEEEIPVLGEGNVQVTVEVTHADGTVKSFAVKTDKTTVADALVEVELISGEDSQWGLYITTVNGEYHKWESDGKYWAFYVNGESSMVGASSVNVEAGATYAFRAE